MFRLFLFTSSLFIYFQTQAITTKMIEFSGSCQGIEGELKQIRQWTESRKGRCIFPNPQEDSEISGLCRTSIEGCLPEEAIEYHNAYTKYDGPNCWNLALVTAGVLPALRYSTSDEMSFFMNSPLCRELSQHEKKQPGDIGAFRTDQKKTEFHGFMWISDSLVYSKNGYTKSSPYAVQSFKKMEEGYNRVRKWICYENSTKNCDLELVNFRCEGMESYLKKFSETFPKGITKAFQDLGVIETCIEAVHGIARSVSTTAMSSLTDSIKVLATYLESEQFKKSLENTPLTERNFVEGALKVRLNSIYEQLDFTGSAKLICLSCMHAAQAIRQAKEALGN